LRFLIVDDDESIHVYLQAMLAPYGEFETALNGEEGLKRFTEALETGNPFDVVMMDILMPGMDGHETSLRMRTLERASCVPEEDRFTLIMTTCLVEQAHIKKAFANAGAALYIVKPLDKDEVISQLKEKGII